VLPSVGVSFAGEGDPTYAVACDLDMPLPLPVLGQNWRFSTQIATSSAPSSYAAVTLRPAAGLRLGPFAFRAGPVGSWVRLPEGKDAFIAGGQAAALAYIPIRGSLRAVVEVGADVYANQVDALRYNQFEPVPGGGFVTYPEVVASTPRAVFRGGAGLAWQW
jgi:hypothetical protein